MAEWDRFVLWKFLVRFPAKSKFFSALYLDFGVHWQYWITSGYISQWTDACLILKIIMFVSTYLFIEQQLIKVLLTKGLHSFSASLCNKWYHAIMWRQKKIAKGYLIIFIYLMRVGSEQYKYLGKYVPSR
jgi:hypothetical protein